MLFSCCLSDDYVFMLCLFVAYVCLAGYDLGVVYLLFVVCLCVVGLCFSCLSVVYSLFLMSCYVFVRFVFCSCSLVVCLLSSRVVHFLLIGLSLV